jgi:hypothetical protein
MAVPGDANYVVRNYVIYFVDPSQLAINTSLYPTGISVSPRTSATMFSAPIDGIDTTSPDYTNNRINIPGGVPTSTILTVDLDSVDYASGFTVDIFGDLFASSASTGGTIAWRGQFLLASPVPSTIDDALTTVRFFEGWEVARRGEIANATGAGANLSQWGVYDASRVVGDLGLALRNVDDISAYTYTPTASTFTSSWEQLYFRVKTFPASGRAEFYSVTNSNGKATSIGVTAGGQLVMVDYSSGSAVVLATGTTVPLNRWQRLDLIINYRFIPATGGSTTFTKVDAYLQRQFAFTGTQSVGTAAQFALHSDVGFLQATAGNNAEIDVDDWTVRDAPNTLKYHLIGFDALDWVKGTHISAARPVSMDSTSSVNWTVQAEYLSAKMPELQGAVASCGTSSSDLIALTDYVAPTSLGVVAVETCIYNAAAGVTGTSGTLGFSGLESDGTTTLVSSVSHNTPAPATTPWSKELVYSRANGTLTTALSFLNMTAKYNPGTLSGTIQLKALQLAVAHIGIFNYADDDTGQLELPQINTHQGNYPNLAYATATAPPLAPVTCESTTYVGNGTVKTFTLTNPPYWMCITTPGNQSVIWNSAQQEPHLASQFGVDSGRGHSIKVSSTSFITTVTVIGSQAEVNQNGVTYTVVAFHDPGMRFCMNASINVDGGTGGRGATSAPTYLLDPSFTPLGAFFFQERSDATATSSTYFRGPGHSNNDASLFATAVSSNIASLSSGVISTFATINVAGTGGLTSTMWRRSDGTYSGLVEVMTYTGNGLGARTVALSMNGQTPFFAIVVPHDGGGSYLRGPSHSSTNSQTVIGGANSTTGITGFAANQISVNTALNTNAVVYEVFALSSGNVPTITPPTGPYAPDDPNGWWQSVNGFTGGAQVITSTQNPRAPRDWTKLSPFCTSAAGGSYLGGFPAASAIFNGHIIYPGNDYIVGTDQPPIRIFDGTSDREIIRIPPVSGTTPAFAIMAMLRVGDLIYITTLDSGSSSANYAGRVFVLSPLANTLVPVGSTGFSSGEVPYALCWHMNRLWVGTNKSDGTAGKVYFIRPGIDTAFTTDRNLSSDSVGGALSMVSYQGKLYIGTDAGAGTFAKVIVRDSAGAYSTSLTATGGTARVNNGFPHMIVFQNKISATYWNPDTTLISKVYQYDGTSWTTQFNGSTTTNLKPYILQFLALDNLYILGGAKDRGAFIMRTADLVSFTELTQFLTGPLTETVIPTYGMVN